MKRNRLQDQPMPKQRNNTTHINLWWTISILVICIIGLIVVIINRMNGGCDKLMDYLSYTGTLLAIVLSIFTIFFSYYSATTTERHLGDIESAVKIITESNDNINNRNGEFFDAIMKISSRLGSIDAKQSISGSNSSENTIKNQELDGIDVKGNSD